MNEEYLRLMVETNERSKANTRRIEDLETQYSLLHEMNTSLQLIAQQNITTKEDMEEMKNDISFVKNEVADVKAEDGQTYKNIKWLILSGGVGYLLSYFLSQVIK